MEDVRDDFKVFTVVPVLSGGHPLPEIKTLAKLQKDANQQAWDWLTEDQRNNLEYLDVVDIQPAQPHHFGDNGECRICKFGITTIGAFKQPCLIGTERGVQLARMFSEDYDSAQSENLARDLVRKYWKAQRA